MWATESKEISLNAGSRIWAQVPCIQRSWAGISQYLVGGGRREGSKQIHQRLIYGNHKNNTWLLHPSGAPAVMCMDGSVTPFTVLLVSSLPGERGCAIGPVLVRKSLKGVCPSMHACVYGCMWVCESPRILALIPALVRSLNSYPVQPCVLPQVMDTPTF